MSSRAVGRPEEPLDPEAGPVQAFAHELRALRKESGLTYRAMVPLANYSYAALQAATAGKALPTWEVTKAFVSACGGDVVGWREKWERASSPRSPEPPQEGPPEEELSAGESLAEESPQEVQPGPEPVVFEATEEPAGGRRRVLVISAVVAVVVGIVLVSSQVAGNPRARPTVTVTTGATAMPLPATFGSSAASSTAPTSDEAPSSQPSRPTVPTGAGQPPATTGTPGTTRTTTPTTDKPDPGENPGRFDGVQEQRTVELVRQQGYNWVDIEYWRHDADTPGELQIDASGVFTAYGARLAVIPESTPPDRARCARITEWRDRVEFAELHVGSLLCARSKLGRYASLEVRSLPSAGGSFIFYGITWH
ncbi:helix-turn-helix domain-containing protein [Saccharothrix stipae]